MPTSDAEGKDWTLARFKKYQPRTVTDIGPGEGTYAKLLRPHEPDEPGVWWTAVEIHKPYVAKYKLRSTKTRKMYDQIHVEDVRESEGHTFHRDLVIAGDVLEHMSRGDAVALLQRIDAGPDDAPGAGHILVSLPIVEFVQGEVDCKRTAPASGTPSTRLPAGMGTQSRIVAACAGARPGSGPGSGMFCVRCRSVALAVVRQSVGC
ncbi:class I SAM-dependent methyltransferase [Streptomyces sp. NPDC102437]|uniref:class I SAM-dependent methyltransferase n=1 Tax=Streptomyces sp. NPDC102437 TaxID=3366175 RepID=UPI0037FAA001